MENIDPKDHSVNTVICTQCGADLMVVGFTIEGVWRESYMRFGTGEGAGPLKIGTERRPASTALCATCKTPLSVSPMQLLEMA